LLLGDAVINLGRKLDQIVGNLATIRPGKFRQI
jgi:hypothetical protein